MDTIEVNTCQIRSNSSFDLLCVFTNHSEMLVQQEGRNTMRRNRFLACIALATITLFGVGSQAYTQTSSIPTRTRITQEERQAAAIRAAAARGTLPGAALSGKASPNKKLGAPPVLAPLTPGITPDYFGPYPNYANSPLPTLDTTTGAITGGIRKFIDTLPGLGSAGANDLGQYISLATPDTTTYPGSDYYEIALVRYSEKMHFDLPATELRGYVQLETPSNAGISKHIPLTYPNGSPILKANGTQAFAIDNPQYLGPVIVSQRNVPVRVKFTNFLPTGPAGDILLPVDTSIMGAGMGPNGTMYTQNRATLHLHGGLTPWISDGTPHQWTVPAGEATTYQRGVSATNVPDMPDPGPGSLNFYYTNQQSARLMFYHDHAYGTTRLNVYSGEAAAYVLRDPVEQGLISSGTIPSAEIPLVIQEKTFVDPANIAAQDPTWAWGLTPGTAHGGDLWFPHVYMPNQNPSDPFGMNAMGRWDYNTWMYPPITTQVIGPKPNPYFPGPNENPEIPGVPDVTITPEAFNDTPMVNGTAYPSITLEPKAYRFRMLNAANDRTFNLHFYYADPVGATVINGGSGYTNPTVTFSGGGAAVQATGTVVAKTIVNAVNITNGGSGYLSEPNVIFSGGGGAGASAVATISGGVVTGITMTSGGSGYTSAPTVTIEGVGAVQATATATITGIVTGINLTSAGSGYTSAPTVTISDPTGTGALVLASPNTEIKMVPAVPTPTFPAKWPTDARDGGVPDPATAGPTMIQIGNEGGFLPIPAMIKPQPITYQYFRRTITVLNVLDHALILAPAERADVIVDFSSVPAGSTLLLYNDAPCPFPGFDTRLDYYTGDPDQSNTGNMTGGAPTTLPGYGPNTRTIMQVKIAGTPAPAFNMGALVSAWPTVYRTDQDPPIVPEPVYGPAYGTTYPKNYIHVSEPTLTFVPFGGSTPVTFQTQDKAIIENWDMMYGRMNALLGGALPNTGPQGGVATPFSYFNPPTELIGESNPATLVGSAGDGTQLWRLDHQGVDTHSMHFHLFNVQVIDKVALDGQLFEPDANEQGWKESVRLNPAVDTILALRPLTPLLPWGVPDSNRPLDPATPLGVSMLDSAGNTVINAMQNYAWEYVWHCHLLGHEENDMMRPIVFQKQSVIPTAPVLTIASVAGANHLTWTDATPWNGTGPASTLGNPANEIGFRIERATGLAGTFAAIGNGLANTTTFSDPVPNAAVVYNYRVVAYNAAGEAASTNVNSGILPPSGLTATVNSSNQITLNWTDNSNNETNFEILRATNPGFTQNRVRFTGLAANTISFVDTTVVASTRYYYEVRANNASGASAWSNTATAMTPGLTIPNAPSGLILSPGAAGHIILNWTDNATNETSFYILRATNAGFTQGRQAFSVGANVTTFNNSGLTTGVRYYYKVRALNAAGSSAYSNGPNAAPSLVAP